MSIEAMMSGGLSLRKAIHLAGTSQGTYYYKKRKNGRNMKDGELLPKVQELSLRKPMYGTRMMAAYVSRELNRPVNRKAIKHAFHLLGWNRPQLKKADLLKSRDKVPKPTGVNQLWEADMTYIWCGRDSWCYLFNVIDVYSREWISYVFDPTAVKENAIMAMTQALQKHPEANGKVTLRVDNGPQYASKAYRKSAEALGVKLDFIAYRTPEQNGNIESFHGRFKLEYIWPQDFNTFQEASTVIADALVDYNYRRPHSSLGYIPPHEFMMRSINK